MGRNENWVVRRGHECPRGLEIGGGGGGGANREGRENFSSCSYS